MEANSRCEQRQEAMLLGRRHKIETGVYLGNGLPPFGYKKVGERETTRLEIVPETAAVVRHIFQWFVHEHLSLTAVTRRLEMRGILPPGNPDYARRKHAPNQWGRDSVRNILRHEVYAGTYYANRYRRVTPARSVLRPREEWLPIAVPALIDRPTWEAAQTRIGKVPHDTQPARFLMSHRLHCACGYAACATTVTNNRGQVYHYYECGQRHRRYTQCDVLNTRADRVDSAIWEWVRDLLGQECTSAQRGVEAEHTNPDLKELALLAEQSDEMRVRRQVIDALNISGSLAREEGQPVVYVRWRDRTTKLWVVGTDDHRRLTTDD